MHQALYGYVEGHRLLASSTRIDDEAQRLLRSLTDVAFDGKSTSYLTICPLPTQSAHAFIRTWPAARWTRPGSVWSHVLLVGLPDLGALTGMQGMADAFHQPHPRNLTLGDLDLSRYREPATVSATEFIDLSKSARNANLVRKMYEGLYGGVQEPHVRLQVDVASDYEDLLLAVYEQQWPRLRRSFSCRTRQRPTTVHVDLELVEKLPSRESRPAPTNPADATHDWTRTPAKDLVHVDWRYRQFLQTCGAESRSGRSEFRPLTRLYEALTEPDGTVSDALTIIRALYPKPRTQRSLKRALFGPAESVDPLAQLLQTESTRWPTAESDRIELAVRCASHLDLKDIDLGGRLVDLYRSNPSQPSPLGELNLESLQLSDVEALVRGITGRAEPFTAVAVATAQPDLGVLIAAQNKTLLAYPELWETLDNDLLIDLLDDPSDPGLRGHILDQLLEQDAAEPLATICGTNPDAWWELLLGSAERHDLMLYRRAATLRRVLQRLGTAALNSPPVKPQTSDQLLTLLLAANLSTGLWRRAASKDWTRAVKAVIRGNDAAPRSANERLAAVALIAAIQSGSNADRTAGWQTCFPYLHEALRSDTFDEEAWSLLDATLPSGVAWDKCNRLRRGLAQEVRKDRWPVQDVQAAIEAAGPDGDALISLIEERAAKKKKDHWLKQLVRLLTR